MQSSYQQTKPVVADYKNLAAISFNKRKHTKHLALSKVNVTGLFNNKPSINPEMLEVFFRRLLPVTYLDWKHSQMKENCLQY